MTINLITSLLHRRPLSTLISSAWRSRRSPVITTTTTSGASVSTYTNESKPVPGSPEHTNPTGWANRLFRLEELRRQPKLEAAPSPVLMICRVKPLRGVMHYHRALLEKYELGQGVKNHTWRLVKNVPSVCEELTTIKHLIRVQPVHFPQGQPTKADNPALYRLLPDGRFLRFTHQAIDGSIVPSQALDSAAPNQADPDVVVDSTNSEQAEPPKDVQFSSHRGYLKRSYLRQYYNRQWRSCQLFGNFFASHYKYKLNQDGKAYRYSRMWRLDDAVRQGHDQLKTPDGSNQQPNQNRFDANWSTYPWARH